MRQLIDQIIVNVEGETEWVELQVHWAGGQRTYSRLRRPVAGTTQLSRSTELKDRLKSLKAQGLSARAIADRLHGEGFKPAKGPRITAQGVRVWLFRYGLSQSRLQPDIEPVANEWTIPQIVTQYQLATSTIHGWIRKGQIQAQQIGAKGGRWLIKATPTEIEILVNNRGKPSHSADEDLSGEPTTVNSTPVSRGAV